ncbi:Uncharacterised protein [uncultured archaeon]|nr:Uncharacterised protein [uncultured archaeon]
MSDLQTGGIPPASIDMRVLSSCSLSTYCHRAKLCPPLFSGTAIPGTKCCFERSSIANFETLLQNLKSVPIATPSASVHVPESEVRSVAASSGGMQRPFIFHGESSTFSSVSPFPFSLSRSGEAIGDFENEGSRMNRVSGCAFLANLMSFVKSSDSVILYKSFSTAWKGWVRGIPGCFFAGRPLRFNGDGEEVSPHKKKFPRSFIVPAGFHVPCKTIIYAKAAIFLVFMI